MKLQVKFIALAATALFIVNSCIFKSHYECEEYAICIAGDSDRVVQISYLEREAVRIAQPPDMVGTITEKGDTLRDYAYIGGDKNVITTASVKLPYYKAVQYISDNEAYKNIFLKVTSANDITTKAVIIRLQEIIAIPRADSCLCEMNPYQSSIAPYEDTPCCNGFTTDSLLHYLKVAKFPCYMEFSQGDVEKTLRRDIQEFNKWYSQQQ